MTRLSALAAAPTLEHFGRHFWDDVLMHWAVMSRDSLKPIGLVTLASANMQDGYAFFTIVSTRSSRHTGVAFDALSVAIASAFTLWPFRMLYAEVIEENYHQFSSGVNKYFEVEGIRREQTFVNGHYQDVFLLKVSRALWEANWVPAARRLRRE